jgi:Tfp pilus assembly protein PilN
VIEQLNLSSQPFRNRALPWTVAVAVACASLVALVFIVGWGRQAQTQAARVEGDVQALRQREQNVREQAQKVTSSLMPEQRIVLAAAHEIVDRKNFSWSRLLSDLEGALPATVRVARINVRDVRETGGVTRADLELTIVGRTPADVSRMLGELARGGFTSAELLTQQPRAAKGEPGTEATLRVQYVQRQGARSTDEAAPPRVAANAQPETP